MESPKYVSPEYQAQLDALAESLRADRAAQVVPAVAQIAVKPHLTLVEAPKNDAGW